MANTTLNTRIILCNDTTASWGTSTKVLLKGEFGIELFDDATPKFKIGNGVDTWDKLPYATLTPTEISDAISTAVKNASHSHSNKAILDAITASFTTDLKTNYDKAYTHSTAAHAPSNAQANIIETVKVNGTALTPSSKAVDITVPTKTSQLTNDSGYKTTDNNTTYSMAANKSATNGNAKVTLTGSDSTTKDVVIKGTGATTVTTDASGNIVVNSSDTKYSHPSSGVTAGTYRSVTVNAQGHVTAGTNPTTIAGYGITDAYTKTQTDNKIATAVASAGHLKRTIVDTLPAVDSADVNTIYMVAKASGAVGSSDKNGYDEYMLIVSGDVKKFEKIGDSAVDLTNYATKTDATNAANTAVSNAAKNYATAAQGTKADNAVQSVKIGTKEYKSGTTVTLPAYPTTLPASDVPAWAKASTKPTYTKSEVGLGNVNNTADADKSVKYATSAGSATKATQDSAGQQINTTYIKGLSVNGKVITYTKGDGTTGTIATQDTNTTYSNMTGATTDTAGKAGLVPAPAAGAATRYLRSDGTWVTPPNTTYSNMTGATSSAAGKSGLVPAPAAGTQGKFLRGDGTWQTPTNTTYGIATASTAGLVKSGSGTNQVSVASSGIGSVSAISTDILTQGSNTLIFDCGGAS